MLVVRRAFGPRATSAVAVCCRTRSTSRCRRGRRAIAGALLSEAPRGREAYERFYAGVVADLGLTTETDANDTVAESELATC